ncbi:hypothetical protein ACVITL_006552 [Rhizobium pisi]
MRLVDQAFRLAHRADAAADLDVLVAGCGFRLFKRFLGAAGDEVEGCAAFHDDGLAGIVYEDRPSSPP